MIIGRARHDRRASCRLPAAAWAAGLYIACAGCTGLRPAPQHGATLTTASAPALNPPTPAAVVTRRQERQLQVFGPILLNPSDEIDEATRGAAAEELVMMRLPEATALLAEALRSEHPLVVMAVAAALEQAPDPLPGLLEDLVVALRKPPEGTRDRLAMLVPRFGQSGLRRITEVALDVNVPIAERAGPIQALASFRSPDAASRLVGLLDPIRAEPANITDAACRALGHLTGFPYGADPAAWRDWWTDVQHLPREQWLSRFVESLSGQLTKHQQEIDRRVRTQERLERRIVETYRDLFPVQPVDQQIQRLPALLGDGLDVVRRFAVGRIDRLLRDGVRVPQALQDQLAERLADPVADIRRDAARILDQCGYDALSVRLAAAMVSERDAENLRVYINILTARPNIAALGPARERLADTEFGDASATLIWEIISVAKPEEEPLRTTRIALREAYLQRHSASVARVLARIGSDLDVEFLMSMLDGDDTNLRRAVADGFAQRGLRQPLLDRADDEVIYPYAVRAIAAGPADLTTLQTLAGLTPSEAMRDEWARGVRLLTARLPRTDILAADTVLSSVRHADVTLRRDILADAIGRAPDADNTWRNQVVRRLAPLQLDTGQPARALDTINLLNGTQAASPELAELKFRAAALAGRYEIAAAIHGDARTWIDLFDQMIRKNPAVAAALRDEIARRFGDQLRGDLKAAFEAASARLAGETAAGQPVTEAVSADGSSAGPR